MDVVTLRLGDSEKDIQRIIVFGSFLIDPLTAQDLDLVVETRPNIRLITEKRALIERCLVVHLPISLHIFTPAEFRELAERGFFRSGYQVLFSVDE